MGTHHQDVDLAGYSLEAKPVSAGDTLAVRGNVRIENGRPVIRGTDETQLYISDRGFGTYRRNLRLRMLKYGLGLVLSLGLVWLFVRGLL